MRLAFNISPVARREVIDIQRYLEDDTPGAGARFRVDLGKCWRYIAQFPQGFQTRHREYRYAPLDVFRYHVIYSVGSRTITVHRVRHMHRRTLKRYFGG